MSHATSRRALWLQKIADQVSHTLSDRIASGELAPGASPGDRETLAAEFVTSVSVIDRVLDQMAEKGVLVPEPDGRYVVSGAPVRDHGFALPEHETQADVVAILELRLGLEAVGANFAAERHDAAQLAEIKAAAEAYETAARSREGQGQADFRFHHAIAMASGNPYLVDLVDYLGPLLIPRLRGAVPADDAMSAAVEQSISEHRIIVTSIEAGEGDAARRAMREHLKRTLTLVQQGSE